MGNSYRRERLKWSSATRYRQAADRSTAYMKAIQPFEGASGGVLHRPATLARSAYDQVFVLL
jgi:hypothetical protein